jgi:hypothetical protein
MRSLVRMLVTCRSGFVVIVVVAVFVFCHQHQLLLFVSLHGKYLIVDIGRPNSSSSVRRYNVLTVCGKRVPQFVLVADAAAATLVPFHTKH